jgi:signal transduction histidine kinase
MSAMFLAMVWHARRRQDALAIVERQAEQRASLLQRQERFLHDASHELRTPVTIARGHLEVHRRTNGNAALEIDVALDELARIEQILARLLLLASSRRSTSSPAWRTSSCAGPRWPLAPGSWARSRPGS